MKDRKVFTYAAAVLLLLAAAAAVYQVWIVQRSYAAVVTSALIKVSIAQNRYYEVHQTYTSSWVALEPFIDKDIKGTFQPTTQSQRPYFLEKSSNRFLFDLQPSADLQRVHLSVRRIGFPYYTLQEEAPQSNFNCIGSKVMGRIFCRCFMHYMADYIMRPDALKKP